MLLYLQKCILIMKTIKLFSVIYFLLVYNSCISQEIKTINSNQVEYTSIEEALKNPEKVYRLNLSNQNKVIPSSTWDKFINIEYLSLKNDHLKQIPNEISKLKNLKTLDLSGNDFEILPKDFTKLVNLEELILNDEKNIDFPKTLDILSKLPKLKSLHLENDNLISLPDEIFKLQNLESLFLNKNKLKEVPKKLEGLHHLQYLDLKNNKIQPELQDMKNLNFGLKINF